MKWISFQTYRLASKRSGDIRRDAYNSLPSHLKEVLETSIVARRDRERLQACSKEFREKLALSSEEDKAKWRGVVDFLSNEGYDLWVKGIMPEHRRSTSTIATMLAIQKNDETNFYKNKSTKFSKGHCLLLCQSCLNLNETFLTVKQSCAFCSNRS